MNKVIVYNQKGEKNAEMDLNPRVFGLEKLDPSLVHFAVRVQRNNARKSTAHTKYRGEVAGSGKKPWQQKGTGRARAGSVRSPLWRGGGITFGPRNTRNYSLKMNQSAFHKSLFTVLSDKVKENRLAVVDSFDTVNKTKELSGRLAIIATAAGLGKKLLLVIPKVNPELVRAAQNLINVKVLVANQLNVLDLINHDLIFVKDSLEVIEKVYLKKGISVK